MTHSEKYDLVAAALVGAKKDFTKAKKSGENSHLGAKYATLGDILDAIEPALNDRELMVMQHMLDTSTETVMHLATRIMHSSGQYMEFQYNMPIEKKTSQAYGSTTSYARRYALAAILGISQSDDDAEIAKMRPEDWERKAQACEDVPKMRELYAQAKKSVTAAEWRLLEPKMTELATALSAKLNAAEAPTGGFNPNRPTATAKTVDDSPAAVQNAQSIESFE